MSDRKAVIGTVGHSINKAFSSNMHAKVAGAAGLAHYEVEVKGYRGACNRCGHFTESRVKGEVCCKWGGCNGTVNATMTVMGRKK